MGHLTVQKDIIINLYQNDKLSIRAIAKVLDSSSSGIKRILHKYNVPMRNKCESLNLCPDQFTSEEFDIVLGSLLGDGAISRQKSIKSECCFYEGHSTKQREYVEYKHKKLHRWIGCKIYPLKHNLNGVYHTTLNFLTRRNKKFTELRNLFYVNNKKHSSKKMPYNLISNEINSLSLAIWAMDDGYNRRDKGFEFCSENFSKPDQNLLIDILRNKFDIISHLGRIRKSEYRIKINKADKKTLFNVIRPHVIPTMEYKIESSEAIRQTSSVYTCGEDMVRTTRKLVEVF